MMLYMQDLIDIGVDRRGYQLRLEQAIKREPVSWKARSVHVSYLIHQYLQMTVKLASHIGKCSSIFEFAGTGSI